MAPDLFSSFSESRRLERSLKFKFIVSVNEKKRGVNERRGGGAQEQVRCEKWGKVRSFLELLTYFWFFY